jgi:hypothetical protein
MIDHPAHDDIGAWLAKRTAVMIIFMIQGNTREYDDGQLASLEENKKTTKNLKKY